MIVFEFDIERADDASREAYWLITRCIKEDAQHTNEIYEQLDAELAYNL